MAKWMTVGSLAALGCLSALIGCSSEQQPKRQPRWPSGSMRAIRGATLSELTGRLGADYVSRGQGSPTILGRQVDVHELVVFVNHDAAGKVGGITALVAGPGGTEPKIDELFVELAKTILNALGVADNDDVSANLAVGIFRSGMGLGHDFDQSPVFVRVTPPQPVSQQSTVTTFKEGFVQRELTLVPSSPMPVRKPIPGMSVEQLEKLLEGFVAKVRVGEEQVLFVREFETHKEVVHCYLKDGGGVSHVESFVGDVRDGADREELNQKLWLLLAELPYEGSNPTAAKAFLNGPKPGYAYGYGDDVGAATFYKPLGSDGGYGVLDIWAATPEKPDF
ncbi:MAG: hypothetical protein FJ276_09090 [Planctomycetes bacterium]|nr:hypothetical protein [Planctomycetota bacterium]